MQLLSIWLFCGRCCLFHRCPSCCSLSQVQSWYNAPCIHSGTKSEGCEKGEKISCAQIVDFSIISGTRVWTQCLSQSPGESRHKYKAYICTHRPVFQKSALHWDVTMDCKTALNDQVPFWLFRVSKQTRLLKSGLFDGASFAHRNWSQFLVSWIACSLCKVLFIDCFQRLRLLLS